MLKNIVTLPFLFVFLSTNAQCLSNFYLNGKLGLSFQQQSERSLSSSGVDLISNRESHSQLGFGNSTKSILSGGVAGGYDFKPEFNVPIRVELEYIARNNGSQSLHKSNLDFTLLVPNYGDNSINYNSRIRTQTLMLNTYLDLYTGTSFMPYVTVGVGMANNRLQHQTKYRVIHNVNTINVSSNKNKFAWSAGTGFIYKISDSLSFDLGYRYIDAGKVSADTSWRSTAFDIDALLEAGVNTNVRYHDVHFGIIYWF